MYKFFQRVHILILISPYRIGSLKYFDFREPIFKFRWFPIQTEIHQVVDMQKAGQHLRVRHQLAEPRLAVVLGLGEKSPGLVPVQETVNGHVRIIQQALASAKGLRRTQDRYAPSLLLVNLFSARQFDTPPLPSG